MSARADLELELFLADRSIGEEAERLGRRLAAHSVSRALVVLMDERLPTRPEVLRHLPSEASGVALRYCQLFDFRRSGPDEALEGLVEAGVIGIKLHPYLQCITPGDFPAIQTLARAADDHGLFVMIDGEYGSQKLFDIRPAEVVLRVEEVTSGKVLFAHGAGAAILEGFSIAQALHNVYLDTSFSVDFWTGRSVEQDFAFAIRALGPDRWMYGSDAPFVPMDQSLRVFESFLERYGFDAHVRRQIASSTVEVFLGEEG